MINFNDYRQNRDEEIDKVTYLNDYMIIDSGDSKYLVKEKDSDKEKIFSYLKHVNYEFYLPMINNYKDYYELYPYYEDRIYDKYTKSKELIHALSLLHLKTTSYVSYSQDKIKEIYEDTNNRIDNLMMYYLDLQDYIESLDFPTPAQYLLLKNISRFYSLLRFSKEKLENWFRDDNKNIREVLLIKDVNLSNFRVGEKNYFVDFKKAEKGLVIYDLVDFYKNVAVDLDFASLFNYYNSRYQLNRAEMNLFYSLIAIPEKISFFKKNYEDTVRVRKVVDYVNVTISFVSEKYEKDEKTDEEKFEE